MRLPQAKDGFTLISNSLHGSRRQTHRPFSADASIFGIDRHGHRALDGLVAVIFFREPARREANPGHRKSAAIMASQGTGGAGCCEPLRPIGRSFPPQ